MPLAGRSTTIGASSNAIQTMFDATQRTDAVVQSAAFTAATRRLVETGAFANFVFSPGKSIYIKSSSGGGSFTAGRYLIESRVDDDTIVIARDLANVGPALPGTDATGVLSIDDAPVSEFTVIADAANTDDVQIRVWPVTAPSIAGSAWANGWITVPKGVLFSVVGIGPDRVPRINMAQIRRASGSGATNAASWSCTAA